MRHPADPGLVTVAAFLHRGDAEVARARVAAAGIAAMVVADDEGGLNPGFFADNRVRLVVRAAEVEAAQAALAEIEAW